MKHLTSLVIAVLLLAAAAPAPAQDNALNLPNALLSEAQRIYQLAANVPSRPGDEPTTGSPWRLYGQGANVYVHSWPSADTVVYGVTGFPGGDFFVTFSGIRVTDYGAIEWQHEQEIQPVQDLGRRLGVNVAAGDTFSDTYSYTFSHTSTLEEETKLNLSAEIKAQLGNISTPASASVTAKVEREIRDRFGETATTTDQITQTLNVKGPANRTYYAYRNRTVVERQTRCQPLFDYSIRFERIYQDNGSFNVTWDSKEQYLRFMRGQADDSVGYMNFPINHSLAGPLAPHFRRHAQPGAEIDHSAPRMTWVDRYSTRITTGLTYEEADEQ